MRGLGRRGEGFFGPPRGGPDHPLVEAVLVLLAFYLASFSSPGSPGAGLALPSYHLSVIALNLPRALLVLYLMAVSDGWTAFGIGGLRGVDLPRGLLCALGALAVVLGPGLLFTAFGIENPLFAQGRVGAPPGLGLLPLILASSMATGYCEELLFRSYLMRRLGQAGLSPIWSGLVSSLLFGSGHGYQGIVGIVSGSLLGLYFAWRWHAGRNIHEIAIGHGLFDSAAFAVLVYS
jgi:uncharacterized protein